MRKCATASLRSERQLRTKGATLVGAAAALSLLSLIACVAPSFAAPATSGDAQGARLYLFHCAPCHGKTGLGDGPDAPYFASPPRNLREGFLANYSTEALVQRIREGRKLPLALDPKARKARSEDVESIVTHLEKLPNIDWRLVERGWGLYFDRCESCHGPDGKPGPSLPDGVRPPRDLSDPNYQRSLKEEDLLIAVRHGHHHMPALVPRIPESEGPPLAAFVRLLSPGFELYSRNCMACHGDDGRGSGSFVETIQAPTVVFDAAYFRDHSRAQIRDAVSRMLDQHQPAMPHFRWDLSEEQARAIVEYLKKTMPRN